MNDKITTILNDIHMGKPIIIVDSYDRENEGDLMIAAEMATSETLAFIAKEARGIMCLPTAKYILDRLNIPMSPSNGADKFATPFTVSVDARHNITTGVSVHDRIETIKVMIDDDSKPEHLIYPGHMFPLRPKASLLKDRQGHTEASVQLCLLANLKPVAVISEIMNDDGTMARMPDLETYARKMEVEYDFNR